MANPQIENGHIRIANELWDAMTRAELTTREYQVLMAILRKTYGWGKKSDAVSVKQIMELTGMDMASYVTTIVQRLEQRRIVSASHKHGCTTVYTPNKDYEQWLIAETSPFAPTSPSERNRSTPPQRTSTIPCTRTSTSPLQRIHNNHVQPCTDMEKDDHDHDEYPDLTLFLEVLMVDTSRGIPEEWRARFKTVHGGHKDRWTHICEETTRATGTPKDRYGYFLKVARSSKEEAAKQPKPTKEVYKPSRAELVEARMDALKAEGKTHQEAVAIAIEEYPA